MDKYWETSYVFIKIVTAVCSETPHPLTMNLSTSGSVSHVTVMQLWPLKCATLHIHIDLLSAEKVIACSLSDDNSGILVIFCWFIVAYLLRNTLGEDSGFLRFCSNLRVVLGVPFVRHVKHSLSVAIYAWAVVRLLTLSSANDQVMWKVLYFREDIDHFCSVLIITLFKSPWIKGVPHFFIAGKRTVPTHCS